MQITCCLNTSKFLDLYVLCSSGNCPYISALSLCDAIVCVKMEQYTLGFFMQIFSSKFLRFSCNPVSPPDKIMRRVDSPDSDNILCLRIQGAKQRNMRHSADRSPFALKVELSRTIHLSCFLRNCQVAYLLQETLKM